MASLHLKLTLKKCFVESNKNHHDDLENTIRHSNLYLEPFIVVELNKEDNIVFIFESLSAPLHDYKSWQKELLEQFSFQSMDCKATATPNGIFSPKVN